jgi:DNA-binding response OmpR family regulator
MKILILEDDDAISWTLKHYLCNGNANMHCDQAKKLPEAQALLSKTRYDLIFVDILLEEGVGTPLIAQARELYPAAPPYICIITAMANAQITASRHKVNKLLLKPFTLEGIDELMLDAKNYTLQ